MQQLPVQAISRSGGESAQLPWSDMPLSPAHAGLAPREADPGPIGSAAGSVLGTRRVVLVEDNALVRLALEAWLEDAGASVVSAACIAEMDEVLRTSLCPDLVIMDHHLSDGNGLDALRRVRAVHGAIPAILLTGDCAVNPDTAQACVMQKPISPADLLRTIQRMLMGRSGD